MSIYRSTDITAALRVSERRAAMLSMAPDRARSSLRRSARQGRRGGGGGVAAPFVPSLYGTVGFWLRGDTVALNGSDVSSWTDKSGNGRHWAQATGALQPASVVDTSRPAVSFSAVATKHLLGPDLATPAWAAAESFLVLRVAADPAASGASSGLWRTSAAAAETSYPFTDGSIYDDFATTSRVTVGNPTPSLASPRIYQTISASGEWTALLDGTQIFTTATNTVGWNATTYLGRSVSIYLDGVIWEWLVYAQKLTAPNRAAVTAYLKSRYAALGIV